MLENKSWMHMKDSLVNTFGAVLVENLKNGCLNVRKLVAAWNQTLVLSYYWMILKIKFSKKFIKKSFLISNKMVINVFANYNFWFLLGIIFDQTSAGRHRPLYLKMLPANHEGRGRKLGCSRRIKGQDRGLQRSIHRRPEEPWIW